MNEKLSKANRPLTMRQQILYGLGDIAANPVYTLMVSFLTFFYTDVLGLNPALIGTLILACKVLDGISDIIAGSIVERTHTAKGSARPWVLRFAVPLAASTVLLFTVPDVSVVEKLIYIFVTYNFAMSVCYTMFNAGLNSMPIYATNDVRTRSSAFAIRIVVGAVVQLLLTTFFMNIVGAFGGDQKAWIIFSIIIAAVSLAASFIAYNSLEENANPYLMNGHRTDDSSLTHENKPSVMASLKALFRNKYWLMVVLLLAFVLFHQIATLSVGVYYATWILHDSLLAGKIALFHAGAMTVAIFAAPVLLNKGISKRTICIGCSISMLAGGILGMISGTSEILFYLSLVLRGAGYGIIAAVINGMLSDSIVYGEWKTGIATPALGMCAYTFVQKVMVGLVTALFGILLGALGYDGLAAAQPESALRFIKLFFLYFPVILYVLQLLLLHFYKLDREMPKILRDLEERHDGTAQNAGNH
ncbi:MAG: MFS transporter [Eubacterium sp.]|nr:MFS transporter [Eubacterium sp.]